MRLYKPPSVQVTGFWCVLVPSEQIDKNSGGDDDDDDDDKFRKQSYWALNTYCGRAVVEVQNVFNMGNNITCSINCNYTTTATVCTVGTWFVSGI